MESGPVVLFLLANLRGTRSTSLDSFGIWLFVVPSPGSVDPCLGVMSSADFLVLVLVLELVLVLVLELVLDVVVVDVAPNPEAC